MKKIVKLLAVTCLVVGILFILYGAFEWYCFKNVLDGSPSLYTDLKRNALFGLVTGSIICMTSYVFFHYLKKI